MKRPEAGVLGKFLTDYQRVDLTETPGTEAAEKRLDALRAEIVRADLTLTCQPLGDERSGLPCRRPERSGLPAGIELACLEAVALGTSLTGLGAAQCWPR